jgi:predicted N-formylglutamate amidohydrolase
MRGAPAADERVRDVVISCEHGGNEVPRRYRHFFVGHDALLQTHRGYDPGALQFARELSEALGAPLVASTTTRLLIDLNRSIGNPSLFSELLASASRETRKEIVESHYRPFRQRLDALVDSSLALGRRVFQLSSHSFTPVLDGDVRTADVGILYDPRRPGEVEFARRWLAALRERSPLLRLRRNYPYTGRADGTCAAARKRTRPEDYVGIELEVNQRYVEQGGPEWDALRADLVASLQQALQSPAAEDRQEAR